MAVDADGLCSVMAGDVDAICKATVGDVDATCDVTVSSTVWILPDGAPFLHQGQQASAGAASARETKITVMSENVRIMIVARGLRRAFGRDATQQTGTHGRYERPLFF
jgi:hypothetical protein